MSTSMKPMPVGAAPPSPAILPMNVVAQKVLPGTDAAMKPLSGSNLSYTTLQTPGQALSLVQDHRPYPTYDEEKPRVSNGDVKEPEPEADAARNNNLSPEASESPDDAEASETDKCRPTLEPSEAKEPPTVPTREEKPLNGKEEVKKDEPKKKEKRTKRKSRELKELKTTAEGKPKRNRVQTQPYQSPLPEIALIVKTLNKVAPVNKNADDKLIVFYRNEFLAVRNAEGSFYVCQAMQNIYMSSRRIRIRWLSQDKNNGEIYSPDFYDFTDFDCILTNLNLNKVDKNKYQLTKIELLRTENILKRAIDVEAGVSEKPSVTEEHPDGLDLSLYKDESQLMRKGLTKPKRQRKRSKRESSSSEEESSSEEDSEDSPDEDKSRSSRSRKRSATIKNPSKAAVPNRAKRALNRGNKSENDASSSSDVKRGEKEAKKPTKNANAAARTKLRGSTQGSETSNSVAAGRGKRVAATSGTADESSRKKVRSKA